MRPRAQVLGDVLPVLGELQRRADQSDSATRAGVAQPEHAEHELAHRVRRELAVAQQLLPGLIAADALVDAVGLDQARERLARQRALAQRRLQAPEQRVLGAPGDRRAPARASSQSSAARRSPARCRRARRPGARSRRSAAGARAARAAAGGWRPGSSRPARAITASRWGARRCGSTARRALGEQRAIDAGRPPGSARAPSSERSAGTGGS